MVETMTIIEVLRITLDVLMYSLLDYKSRRYNLWYKTLKLEIKKKITKAMQK